MTTRTDPSADAGTSAPQHPRVAAVLTVVFLGVTAGVQMSDMGLQAISLSAIQQTFGVGDAAAGALQGLAGVFVGSALAVPLARFADRYSRKRVLLCLILASTAMMVLSALAPNFPLFFLGRSAAGITEFAMVPLVYSMIPDLVPERHRVAANLLFAALVAAGASGGFYFAGALLNTAQMLIPWLPQAWRSAFLMLSLAGLPLLLLGVFTVDPPRRSVASATTPGASLWQFFASRRQTILCFVGAAGFAVVAVQAVNHLVALALERRFDADPSTIGHVMGLIVMASAMGCLPVAGVLDRVLAPRLGSAVRPLIMCGCTALAAPVLMLLVWIQDISSAFAVIAFVLFVTSTANALVPTMLQDLAPPGLRARSFAVWSFVVSVFGASGPLMAGLLSEWTFDGALVSSITAVAVPVLIVSMVCAWRLSVLSLQQQGAARPRRT